MALGKGRNRAAVEEPPEQADPNAEQARDYPATSTEPTKEDLRESNDLERLLAELGDEGSICIIKRKRMADMSFKYLCRWPVTQTTLENLKRQFGGGQYSIQVNNRLGQFTRKIVVEIDEMFKGVDEARAEQNGNGNHVPLIEAMQLVKDTLPPQQNSSEMLPLLIQMMNQNAQQQALMMQGMMQSMAGIVSAIAGRPAPEAPQMPEMLMKALLDKNDPSKQIEMLTQLKALVDKGGNDDEDDGRESMTMKLLAAAPAILGALSGGAAARREADAPPIVSRSQGVSAPPSPSNAERGMRNAEQTHTGLLTPEFKSLLIGAAKKDGEVELYFDVVYDMAGSDENMAGIQALLAGPDGFKTVIGDVPSETLPWFQSLASMIGEWKPEPDEQAIPDKAAK